MKGLFLAMFFFSSLYLTFLLRPPERMLKVMSRLLEEMVRFWNITFLIAVVISDQLIN